MGRTLAALYAGKSWPRSWAEMMKRAGERKAKEFIRKRQEALLECCD
ncbi:MAG: hypothetical protein ACLTQL_01330 [Eisenbergiella sp.]